MTEEQYKKRYKELYDEYQEKIKELDAAYAIDNNPYTVGQLFRDHKGAIKIEKIEIAYSFNNELPCCLYFGPEMKLNGTPQKSGSKRQAWQSNEFKKPS